MSYSRYNRYNNTGYPRKQYQKKNSAAPYIIGLLAVVFFASLIYEVTSDGISSIGSAIPPIQWGNLAGDTIANGLQVVIFSLIAKAAGSRYTFHGRPNRDYRSSAGNSGPAPTSYTMGDKFK